MIKKKFFAILAVALLTINSSTLIANAKNSSNISTIQEIENVSTENVSKSTSISNSIKVETRSKDDIKNIYKKLQTSLNGTSFEGNMYKEVPVTSSPYKAGSLSDHFVQDGLNTINFFRYVVGLPADITIDPVYANKAQHASTLMSAINKLTHHPEKPNDMSQDFFDLAYSGTSSSNIGKGHRSISNSIRSYLADKSAKNIDRVGHRRWLLNPSMKKTGFGFVNSNRYTAQYSFDRSRKETVEYDHIAWPAKNIHPVEYFDVSEPWSISLNPQKFSNISYDTVKVNVKRLRDNKSWTLDKNIPQENKNDSKKSYFNVNKGGFGIGNAIIFRLGDISEYVDGDKFEITISGLKDNKGNDTTVQYSTEFFSVKPKLPENMSKVDIAYKEAYDSTMNVKDASDLLEKQTLITTARLSLAKLNTFPNQTSNIGTFSSILDKPQHEILVNIVDSIKNCENNITQANINIARNNIPSNLPNNSNWLSTYSQAVDKLQGNFTNKVSEAVKIAKEEKTEASVNIAKELAKELSTSVSEKIARVGEEFIREIDKIIILN